MTDAPKMTSCREIADAEQEDAMRTHHPTINVNTPPHDPEVYNRMTEDCRIQQDYDNLHQIDPKIGRLILIAAILVALVGAVVIG